MAELATQDAGPILADDLMRDRARQFVEFLDDDVSHRGSHHFLYPTDPEVQTQASYNYRESIKRMLDNEQVRLIVNIDDLRDYDRAYADGWVAAGSLM